MKLLIIIPAYNEEDSIVRVISSVNVWREDADIVVVNDGSTDRTGERAEATGKAAVIHMPLNVGIGGAMQTGYRYAARGGYDVAVQLDGDGQHEAQELDKLLAPLLAGEADCCIGSRFLHKTDYRSSWSRRLGIRFFSWMVHWMTGAKATDPTSGFRAVNRKVIELFAADYPEDYPEVEAIVLLRQRGFRLAETSVRMHERQSGESSITPLKSMYYMAKVSLAVLMTRLRGEGGAL
ncbi:glycosyl transferase family 2 [Gordoniibacillus kamchatkensis]|uniref:Glycosyl transferase family 2 n=1 Tax=Gordoniibacillus kamchatkensis TaxID=1590651 RepID=A0ABR5AJT6_9BACL|nr:glycosyltransferase family 2 protein [Paenibacillus sp. VKM B-2647]KIL41197.1 glycosyl transferase family 2 [Paenibacillus sp. VKM B-2647]